MLKPIKKVSMGFLVIIILSVSTLTILSFQEKEIVQSKYFVVECDSKPSVRISDGRFQGIFNTTTREFENSVSFSLRFYQELFSFYSNHNLSFIMESECILGNGRYDVNQTMRFELVTSNNDVMWEMKTLNPPGFLVLNHSLSNSTNIYEQDPNEKWIFIILWELNLTSSIVPKESYDCRLSIRYNLIESSNGISFGTSISIITLSWIIGIIALIDLVKRTR